MVPKKRKAFPKSKKEFFSKSNVVKNFPVGSRRIAEDLLYRVRDEEVLSKSVATKVFPRESWEAAERILEEIRKEDRASTKILDEIQKSEWRTDNEVKRKGLEDYLFSGGPRRALKLKETIVAEVMKEPVEGPATERLALLRERLDEAGVPEKMAEVERNLRELVKNQKPIIRMAALETAGELKRNKVTKELDLEPIIEMAATDNDEQIRFQAGKIALDLGMSKTFSRIINAEKEDSRLRKNLLKLMQEKQAERKS